MDEYSADILKAIHEIRDLIRLMAEPAIAERDKKLRSELRRIVGNSVPKAKSVLLMDGSRTQSAIQRETGIDKGYLSTEPRTREYLMSKLEFRSAPALDYHLSPLRDDDLIQ